jgi:hypothetical protein
MDALLLAIVKELGSTLVLAFRTPSYSSPEILTRDCRGAIQSG